MAWRHTAGTDRDVTGRSRRTGSEIFKKSSSQLCLRQVQTGRLAAQAEAESASRRRQVTFRERRVLAHPCPTECFGELILQSCHHFTRPYQRHLGKSRFPLRTRYDLESRREGVGGVGWWGGGVWQRWEVRGRPCVSASVPPENERPSSKGPPGPRRAPNLSCAQPYKRAGTAGILMVSPLLKPIAHTAF